MKHETIFSWFVQQRSLREVGSTGSCERRIAAFACGRGHCWRSRIAFQFLIYRFYLTASIITTIFIRFLCAIYKYGSSFRWEGRCDGLVSLAPSIRSKPWRIGWSEMFKYEFRSQWLPKRVRVFVSSSRLLLMVKSWWLETYKYDELLLSWSNNRRNRGLLKGNL